MNESGLIDDADIQIVVICCPGVVVPLEDRRGNIVDSLRQQIEWEQRRCGEREGGHHWAFLELPAMGTHDRTRHDAWIVASQRAEPPVNMLVCLDCNEEKLVAVNQVCPRCLAAMGQTVSHGEFAKVAGGVNPNLDELPCNYVAQWATCPDCGYTIIWCGFEQ